ncbi:exported hypothetical protein [Candidatus Zixiibacteriota bacterium]|nr:exported hypothetical protein [candidate division Zixibacteria bacterium]
MDSTGIGMIVKTSINASIFNPGNNSRGLIYACYILSAIMTLLTVISPAHAKEKINWDSLDAGNYTPLWQDSVERPIKWILPIDSQFLLVNSDTSLACFETPGGRLLWKNPSLKNSVFLNSGAIRGDSLIYISNVYDSSELRNAGKPNHYVKHYRLIHFHMLNCRDGSELWNGRRFGFNTVFGFHFLPSIEAIMMYGQDSAGSDLLIVADMRSGSKLWGGRGLINKKKLDLYRSNEKVKIYIGKQPPVFDSRETMITCLDGEYVRKFIIRSGQIIWEYKLNAGDDPAPLEGYAAMTLNEDSSIIVVPFDHKLIALSTETGLPIWKKPPKFNDKVRQIAFFKGGLVVSGGPDSKISYRRYFMARLNVDDGVPLWKKELRRGKELTNFILLQDRALILCDSALLDININDGSYRDLTRAVKFKGPEDPRLLQRFNGNLLLETSSELMLLSDNGDKIYHSYHALPGDNGLALILVLISLYACDMAINGELTHLYMPLGGPEMPNDSPFVRKGGDHAFMFTNVKVRDTANNGVSYLDSHYGIVKLNKLSGLVECAIALDDEPDLYKIDERGVMLYVVTKKKHIAGYKFRDYVDSGSSPE